jgi:hypothetical protein
MAYAAYADIQSEFKNQTFSASTKLTSTEVTEIITQTENKINAELGQVYVTPVTNSTDISILKRISIMFVKHRVENILKIKSGEKLDSEDQENLEKKAQDELDKIIEKRLLHNTTRRTTNNSGVEDYNSNNEIRATFDVTNGLENQTNSLRDVDFW